MRRFSKGLAGLLPLALLTLLPACRSEEEDEPKFACHYEFKSDLYCSSGSFPGTWTPYCLEVDSEQACRDFARGSSDSDGECTSSDSYQKVSVRAGECDAPEVPAPADPDPDPSPGRTCDTTPGAAPCAVCTATSCCNEFIACDDDPDCPLYLSCRAACTDNACHAGCAEQYPGGKPELDAWLACTQASCAADCS